MVGCGGSAGSKASLAGTYVATVPASAGVYSGHWSITFAHGKDAVKRNGTPFVSEHVTVTGHTVTFRSIAGPHACPQPGRYKWALSGAHVRFTRISDGCAGRISTLSHELTKTT